MLVTQIQTLFKRLELKNVEHFQIILNGANIYFFSYGKQVGCLEV